MTLLASVLMLLQLSAALLTNANSNQNITPEQRDTATAFANTAIQVALEYLSTNPITSSTLTQTPVQNPAPTPTPTSTATSSDSQGSFGGAATSTGPVRVVIWDIDNHFSYTPRVNDFSINGVPTDNKIVSFSLDGNQDRIEITLDGEAKANIRPNNAYYNVIEFQNLSKGTYDFTIKVSKDNRYGTLSGTINANTNCGPCNITNTVFSTAE